ncbi:serine protease inhibitor I/II-like [Schistocerca cancellata]|uniref:serine protease inhibitor I/II-like n=1 Tax=Schistocerca cancellata TaxID=274614 RepID=UPI0021182013|nr:serine protease inhibitor I/II-like [Schistocerca cancellata]XP_049767087.1 serine protease inhibitor I/II-like [Schistocerca cancellata]XP_049767088.1 serine protease inhibitor I/II-like [Schistocerca cancellata]
MKAALASSVLLLLLVLQAPAEEPDNWERREVCTPGDTMAEDCNDCFCIDRGQWMCTLRKCGKQKRQARCPPGTTFLRKCSRCVCDDDGETAKCTRTCPGK